MAIPRCEFCGAYDADNVSAARQCGLEIAVCKCDKSHLFPWRPLLLIVLTWFAWFGCYAIYGGTRHWWVFVMLAITINCTHDLEKVSWKTFLEAYRKWST